MRRPIPGVPNHNLPSRLTSFIGREREIAEGRALVQAERLVSLVGPPGVGKTRLSVQIAAGLQARFPDGVWLVELAPLSDPELVPHAVADVLGVREAPGRSLTAALAGYLRNRRLLLLLDNCEHLIAAAATLAETLLQACPGLCVLATSREPLAIEGERLHRVPTLEDAEAERLFVERAVAASPSFALTERTAPVVRQLCARLDGIPLAIELAAARVRALSVEQIDARLGDRFRLLTGGSRTALPRQQTLRGAVDWSYDLLAEPEQALLRRLAVFAGGFTLDAAEGVSGDLVFDALVSLVDRSLVQVDEGEEEGERRYRLLETLREYGQEELSERGELVAARNQHRDYFLAFAERIGPALTTRDEGAIVVRLEREHDNLRAALSWCLESPEANPDDPMVADAEQQPTGAAIGVRLAAAIWRLWHLRGLFGEGRRWLERVLAEPPADTSPAGRSARRLALHGVANLSAFQGDYRAAVDHMTANLALCREIGDDQGVIMALYRLGFFLAHLDEPERGAALCAESVTLARRLGDPTILAPALHASAQTASIMGQWEASVALAEEAIALFRQVGNVMVIAYDLRVQGTAIAKLGDPTRATQLAEEGMRISQELGDRRGIGNSYKDLGQYALLLGNVDRALEQLGLGIALYHQIGDEYLGSICISLLGRVKIVQATRTLNGDSTSGAPADRARAALLEAARLFAAGEVVRELAGVGLPADLIGTYDRDIAVLREHLDEAELARAWAEGRATSFEEAVEYALALTAPAQEAVPQAIDGPSAEREATGLNRSGAPEAARLTAREREVAALVARGRTNRQIAETLVLSERTVHTHMHNILGKLELSSRAQVAAWAVEQGLAGSR